MRSLTKVGMVLMGWLMSNALAGTASAESSKPNDEQPTEAAALRLRTADDVDAAVAQLDEHDRALIAKFQGILTRGDPTELDGVGAYGGRAALEIHDPDQRALWAEILYIATMYSEARECVARGFLFMLYVDSWRKERVDTACAERVIARLRDHGNRRLFDDRQYIVGTQCTSEDPAAYEDRKRLFSRAQDYLIARYGNIQGKPYACE